MIRFLSHKITRLSLAIVLMFATAAAQAGAFQLFEQSAAGTGNYHAGGAAEANDASTEFYNPAGMVRIHHQQISVGGVIIPADVNFKGRVSGLTLAGSTPSGGVNGGTFNFVPNLHYVLPLSDHFFFGFGVTIPFGLATDYPSNLPSSVSQAATKTKLQAININPNLAVAIDDHLSLAVGFDALYGKAEYDAVIPLFGPSLTFNNTLSNWAYGFNLGLLFQFNPHTRIGVSYRSEIRIKASGKSTLTGLPSTTVRATLPLPATTTLSIYHDFTKKLAVMASAFYTEWSDFATLSLMNTALLPGGAIVVHENYRNTWNLAIGANYKVSHKVTLKVGAGHDQTPTRDGFRDIRLPGANRYALALGIHVQATNTLGVEAGWTHFFISKANVNNSKGTLGTLLPTQIGTATVNVNVIGCQLTWDIS